MKKIFLVSFLVGILLSLQAFADHQAPRLDGTELVPSMHMRLKWATQHGLDMSDVRLMRAYNNAILLGNTPNTDTCSQCHSMDVDE